MSKINETHICWGKFKTFILILGSFSFRIHHGGVSFTLMNLENTMHVYTNDNKVLVNSLELSFYMAAE